MHCACMLHVHGATLRTTAIDASQVVHVPRGAVAGALGLDTLLALLVLVPHVLTVDVALLVNDGPRVLCQVIRRLGGH